MNPICFEQIFLGETFFKIKISFLTLIWRQKWCYFAWQHDKQLFFLLFPDLCRQKVESRTWYNSVKLPAWHCLPTIPHGQRPKTCPCLAWDPIKKKKIKKKSWIFRIRGLEICGEATCLVFMIWIKIETHFRKMPEFTTFFCYFLTLCTVLQKHF